MARNRKPMNKMTTQPQPSAGVSVSGDEPMGETAPEAATDAPKESGAIDTGPFVAEIEKNVPPDLMKIFKVMVLKGDTQMFAKDTHQMTLDQLDGPGPMAEKLSKGVAALMYILNEKSNKTLPQQLMEPVGTVLLCHAFDFLQESGDPEATSEMFGDAVDQFKDAIHNALGVTPEQFDQAVQEQGNKAPDATGQPPQAAPQPGILGAQA